MVTQLEEQRQQELEVLKEEKIHLKEQMRRTR